MVLETQSYIKRRKTTAGHLHCDSVGTELSIHGETVLQHTTFGGRQSRKKMQSGVYEPRAVYQGISLALNHGFGGRHEYRLIVECGGCAWTARDPSSTQGPSALATFL